MNREMAEMDDVQALAVLDEEVEFEEEEVELKKKRTKDRAKRDDVSRALYQFSNYTYSPMGNLGNEESKKNTK